MVSWAVIESAYTSQTAKSIKSMSIRYQTDAFASDRYLVTLIPLSLLSDVAIHEKCHGVSTGFSNYLVRPNISVSVWVALTLWGRVTNICVSKLTIIGSDNGLSPGRCQAIIWILLIRPLGTNFSNFSHSRICIWNCRLKNGDHFVSASMR